jgi:hypothetical protein
MLRIEVKLRLEMRTSPWKGLHDNEKTLIPARSAPFYPESIKGSLPALTPFHPLRSEGLIPIRRILIFWFPDMLVFYDLA